MTVVPVVVKHVGKSYEVDLDTSQPAIVFKQTLHNLTGVPVDRQKVLTKGTQIKDDTDLSTIALKPKHPFMLLGSAGPLPQVPKNINSNSASAVPAEEVIPEPSGLLNVGNTCYANATLQTLAAVPELTSSLKAYRGSNVVLSGMASAFKYLESNKAPQPPGHFLGAIRMKFPQFNETDQHGLHKQQDAEELWTQLLYSLRTEGVADPAGKPIADNYFEGRFETSLKSTETDEPATKGIETFDKLSCHITINTNFLKDGLLAGLKEDIEKHSETLGRDAHFALTKEISRLPKYLTVHFVRFYWRRDTNKKSKILRKVAFPFQLDVTDLCTDELKQKILPAREQFREIEGAFEEARRAARRAKFSSLAVKKDKIEDTLPKEKQEELRAALKAKVHPDIAEDVGSNPYGIYDLAGVITHQGMSADSGHYQAFIKNDREPGTWWRFNDDKVSLVHDEKIETLSGGGESDSALILLYRTSQI